MKLPKLILIGLAAGILAGLFGVGGGVVLVPFLVWFCGFSQHRAQGTSLMVLVPPTGLLAVLQYYHHGYVSTSAGLLLVPGVFAGAFAGSLLAQKIPARHMRRIFAAFLLVLGFWQITSAWLRWR